MLRYPPLMLKLFQKRLRPYQLCNFNQMLRGKLSLTLKHATVPQIKKIHRIKIRITLHFAESN